MQVLEVCKDELTDDCDGDPLLSPWSKLCDTGGGGGDPNAGGGGGDGEQPRGGVTFVFEQQPPLVSALVQQSLGPVTSLLQRSLDQVRHQAEATTTTTERQRQGEEEDVSDILRLLQQRGEDTGLQDTRLKSKEKRLKSEGRAPTDDIFFTIPAESVTTSRPVTNIPVTNKPVTNKPVSSRPVTNKPVNYRPVTNRPVTNRPVTSSSIYFDPILNTRPLAQHQPGGGSEDRNISASSLTQFLSFQLQQQFSTTVTTTAETATAAGGGDSLLGQTAAETKQRSKLTETLSATATTAELAATTISTTSTTESTALEPSADSGNLSPADFLRLCFISNVGCDFSQNEIPQTEAIISTTTTSSPSTTTTTGSAVPRAPKRISGPERELRELVRRCFVSGDCGGGGEDVKTTSPPPRPAPPSTTTPSPRQREVHRRVLERARACLFNGEC